MSPREHLGITAVGALVLGLAALGSGHGATYARFSDFQERGAVVGAGVWAPDPPTECGAMSQYAGIVWGTPGDDELHGGNQRQVIMGLGGDDVIYGGNSGDCLVGGDGNDRLYGGNAKDILIGDNGDDQLEGGNGKDLLDGGGGIDACDGGNGSDTLRDCEDGATSTPTTSLTISGTTTGDTLIEKSDPSSTATGSEGAGATADGTSATEIPEPDTAAAEPDPAAPVKVEQPAAEPAPQPVAPADTQTDPATSDGTAEVPAPDGSSDAATAP